jgi:uncharacterized protein DUF3108
MIRNIVLTIKLFSSIIILSFSSLTVATNVNNDISPTAIANSSPTTSPEIKPFIAKYSILHKSKKVGEGTRKLVYLDDNTLEYSYKSDISWLIFSDTRTEKSTLKYNKDKLTPLKYEYKREGTGRDKHYLWQFDASKNTATDIKKKRTLDIDFSQPLQDTLSYHLQHRLKMIEHPNQKQFVYPVIKTSGKIQSYVYQYDGKEELMLPYGLIKTIRLKRELIEKKRITYAWFAPELNYLLVKLYQVKGGTEQFEAQLTSLTITD